jgi:hypothetical protein
MSCIVTPKYKINKNMESYLEKSNCSNFLGALILILNTPLEHHSSLSKATNSLMLVIKSSTVNERSSPNSINSYGKVNTTFAHFVVELLAVNLLFDCWFNPLISPNPYGSKVPDEIYRDLTSNRDLMVSYCICHKLGTTAMFDLMVIILYLLTLHPINLCAFRLVTYQFVLIVIILTSNCMFEQSDNVQFVSIKFVCTFNLYAFLSLICIYLIYLLSICVFCCQGQDVFRQTKKQPWPFSPLKKLYALLVTYKGKFTRGIISLFEHYEEFKVCKLLSFKLYLFKSNVSILIIWLIAELHVDLALGCASVCTSSICSPT